MIIKDPWIFRYINIVSSWAFVLSPCKILFCWKHSISIYSMAYVDLFVNNCECHPLAPVTCMTTLFRKVSNSHTIYLLLIISPNMHDITILYRHHSLLTKVFHLRPKYSLKHWLDSFDIRTKRSICHYTTTPFQCEFQEERESLRLYELGGVQDAAGGPERSPRAR